MAASAMAELRREGNEYFQAGRYAEALAAYARALDLPEAGPEASQRALLYRNRAACHLKLVSQVAEGRGGVGRSGGSVFFGFPSAAFPSQEDYAQAEADASRGERPPTPASPAALASASAPAPKRLPFAPAQLWSWTGMT